MNARRGHFVKPYRALGLKRLGPMIACAGACVLTSACVGNPFEDAKVDPRSPIAAEVPKLVKADHAYPTFAAVPAKPTDVRPPRQYGVAVRAVDQAAAQLEKATADNTWTLQNTDAFAAGAQAAAGPDLAPPQPAETEAFAAAQRKRATPPPPAKH
jgi:hypothetical protein